MSFFDKKSTLQDGQFRIHELKPGKYHIMLKLPGTEMYQSVMTSQQVAETAAAFASPQKLAEGQLALKIFKTINEIISDAKNTDINIGPVTVEEYNSGQHLPKPKY